MINWALYRGDPGVVLTAFTMIIYTLIDRAGSCSGSVSVEVCSLLTTAYTTEYHRPAQHVRIEIQADEPAAHTAIQILQGSDCPVSAPEDLAAPLTVVVLIGVPRLVLTLVLCVIRAFARTGGSTAGTAGG
ncbi:hypothetical protein C8J57DRAFT_1719551 [Mycena rebaudengoi]|nr:hypothetical protein C8J57DRAFT_1719551 [Mycena rebaudengoi]